MSDAKRIHLIGMGRLEEDKASEVISPGHLIELHVSSGRKVRKHTTEGDYAELAFALEDALQGKAIADNYASADRVTYVLAKRGDVIQAWLKDAEVVVVGDLLISAGDGTLIKLGSEATAATVNQVLAVAEEAVSPSGAAARIDVRVL